MNDPIVSFRGAQLRTKYCLTNTMTTEQPLNSTLCVLL